MRRPNEGTRAATDIRWGYATPAKPRLSRTANLGPTPRCQHAKKESASQLVPAEGRLGTFDRLVSSQSLIPRAQCLACALPRAGTLVSESWRFRVPDLQNGSGAIVHEARADIGGFKKFILRGNVVDLAVGLVIGAAFGAVVQAIVKDILNPIINKVAGAADISSLSATVGGITFPIGDLLNALLTSILIALVVYFVVVLPVNRLMDRYKPQAPRPPPKIAPSAPARFRRRLVAVPSAQHSSWRPLRKWPRRCAR